jgi:hypothetical protein
MNGEEDGSDDVLSKSQRTEPFIAGRILEENTKKRKE